MNKREWRLLCIFLALLAVSLFTNLLLKPSIEQARVLTAENRQRRDRVEALQQAAQQQPDNKQDGGRQSSYPEMVLLLEQVAGEQELTLETVQCRDERDTAEASNEDLSLRVQFQVAGCGANCSIYNFMDSVEEKLHLHTLECVQVYNAPEDVQQQFNLVFTIFLTE